MTFAEEPRDLEDAEEDTDRALGVFPNPPIDECPIVFLGFHGAYVVFLMPEGEIRDELAGNIGRLIKVDIFNDAAGQGFLSYWRDKADKLQRDLAVTWFIRQCRFAGYWDRSRPQRGLGVWPGEHGEVVLHRGAELWTYGADGVAIASVAEAMRERRRGPIWRLRAAAPAPSAAASVADGDWVRRALELWRWGAIGDDGLSGADVMAGWLMVALLGAVAPFRPHLLTYALMGSGKTTLVAFTHGLLSALAGDVIDSFSAAGLKNDLGGMARPVIIDEAEAQPGSIGPGPVEQAMDLLRRMATGEGAVRKQGDIGGGSVTQTAVGAVMMAAVNPVRLGPADASRVAEVRLLPLVADDRARATDVDLAEAVARARELAPALLGRALSSAPRYLADVAALKAALMRSGSEPRSADLVAALAAGRRLLLFDAPLDDAGAGEEAMLWRGMMAEREGRDAVMNPGEQCLQHLFSWPSGQHVHDRIATLGELVVKAVAHPGDEWQDTLTAHGLKVQAIVTDDGRPWMLVANHHPALERVFERTPWRDWRRTLPYLDALGGEFATRAGRQMRFGLIQQRCIGIPLSPWLGRLERGRPNERPTEDADD